LFLFVYAANLKALNTKISLRFLHQDKLIILAHESSRHLSLTMKPFLVFIFGTLATAFPVDSIELDPELALRRVNITERMPDLEERQASSSINQLIKNRGKGYFGTATDRGLLQREKNAAIINANFGQVTPENSMKWQSLNPSQGQYNWGDADYLVDFAQQNGKSIRGHVSSMDQCKR
jgi:endo-1,4-beta-xylanase